MQKVLLVEDEELIRTMMKINLEKAGYEVACCHNAESMLEMVTNDYFDLILLDIMLPGMQGDQGLIQLRERNVKIPVIMVTAKNNIEIKVEALEAGADDYLAKPFNVQELLARVHAIIRRSQGERMIPSNRRIKIGEFEIDIDKCKAYSNNGEITLSEKEIKLLTFFQTHAGESLQRMDILEEVWGMDTDPTPRTIDNYIVKFRKLFERDLDNPQHFLTVRSKGYRFVT